MTVAQRTWTDDDATVTVVAHAHLETRELLEREGPLAKLHEALADAEDGSGRLVLVGGEAGVPWIAPVAAARAELAWLTGGNDLVAGETDTASPCG